MSAEDVDLPALGKVKKEYVYAAGALVVGIAGYAWWHARGSNSGSQLVVNGNDVVPATDRVSPSTGDSTVDVDGTAGKITTNAQWTTYVTDKLQAYGYDPIQASASLGKWISRATSGYTTTDVEVIQRAVGMADYPPQNGPWVIPTVSTTPPTPGGSDNSPVSTVLNSAWFNTNGWSDEALKSPWRITTAQAGESWKDITARVYSLNPATQSARINEVAAYLEKTNKAQTGLNAAGNGPKTGSQVVYR